MDIILTLGLSSVLLVTTVLLGGWVFYPLLLTLVLFLGVYRWRGVGWLLLWRMMGQGARQSLGVLSILLLIGLLMAVWMAAGTVPALVYYGLRLMQPQWFMVSAFLLMGVASILLGTSFGAVGTLGVALMIMARSGNVDESWTAGAIIAGAYVGDRCSPLSSSAHLVATLTGTDIYRNLQAMIRTTVFPLVVTVGIYLAASWFFPLQGQTDSLEMLIPSAFRVDPIVLVPAIAVLLLASLRVPVKLTLSMSLVLALVLAMGMQGYTGSDLVSFMCLGFHLDQPAELSPLLQGGGLWSMGKVCSVVILSTALSGLLSGTNTFGYLQGWLARLHSRRSQLGGTLLISAFMAAYGCTQTIAILLTHQLVWPNYARNHLSRATMALDLENTAVVLSPLVPWNIAGLVPATLLATHAGFIPYAVYLYILPLWAWLQPTGMGLRLPRIRRPDKIRPETGVPPTGRRGD